MKQKEISTTEIDKSCLASWSHPGQDTFPQVLKKANEKRTAVDMFPGCVRLCLRSLYLDFFGVNSWFSPSP